MSIPAKPALPPIALQLGYAGLLPQIAVVVTLAAGGVEWRFNALAIGYAYAALILSFLGGLWWGLAARDPARVPNWVWVAAVIPSLIALASAIPWAVGTEWPGPSLLLLGIALIASIVVDKRLDALGLCPDGWMTLRSRLSLGLGALTLAAGWL